MKTINILKIFVVAVLFLSTQLLATGPRVTSMLLSPDTKEIFALDLPPFISTDTQKSGMLNEIVALAFQEMDMNVVITTLPLQSMVKYYLHDENAIGIMGRHLGLSDKEKETLLSIPLFIAEENYIYYKPSHPKGVVYTGELSSFKGLTYGAAKGEDTTAYEKEDIKVKHERTLSLFKKLKNGTVDFINVPKQSAQWFLAEHFAKDTNDFVRVEKSSGTTAISLYFNTNNPKGKEIADIFKQGLQKILKSGKYGDILRKHISDETLVKTQLDHMHELLK